MRTRLLVIPIILACFLLSCATWKSEMTRAYKATGALGESYRVTASSACVENLLEPHVCEALKKLNNKARTIWLQAGEILKLAIATNNLVERQELLSRYHVFLETFNQVFADFLKMASQIKKGELNEPDGDRSDLVACFAKWAGDNRITP